MDGHRFDALARAAAGVTTRRGLLRGLTGLALGGLASGLGTRGTGAQGKCRTAGHPCEGNQTCCDGHICVPSGPGSSLRCTPCLDGEIACGNVCIPRCRALDQCHVAGVCNPALQACTNPPIANGTGCGTGLVCLGGACQSGCFVGGLVVPPGTANPGNACQACRPELSTTDWSNQADGVSCSDGDACTTGDTCVAGACTGGARVTCPPCQTCSGGACVADTGQNGASCPAGSDRCFGAYVCAAGACTGTNPVTCSGGPSQCQAYVCNPDNGLCDHVRNLADGVSCDDGDACTINDACTNGVCQGEAVVCPPPGPCFSGSGSCIPGSGACDTTYQGDGATCAGGICAGEQCCQVRSGDIPDCDPTDGGPCVTDGGPLCCPGTPGQRCDECYEIRGADGSLQGGLCCPPEQQCGPGNCCWFGKVCVGGACVEPEQVCAGGAVCSGDKCCRTDADAFGTGVCCGTNEVCAGGACVPNRRPCSECGPDESCVGATFEEDANGNLVEATPGYCCPFGMIINTNVDPPFGPISECCNPRSYACQSAPICIGFNDDFTTCTSQSVGFLRPR